MKKLLLTIVKCLAFFFCWALIVGLSPTSNDLSPVLWRFEAEFFPLLGTVLCTMIFYFIEKREIPILAISNFGKGTFYGLTSGVAWLGLTTLVFYLFGVMKVESMNPIDMLWLWVISAFLNVIMQELLVRGYLYQLLKKKYNLIASVIATTILFTLLHGGAIEAGVIPTLNVITMSLFMSVLLEYTQSLIAPTLAHAFWNIIGALILGSVSLADDYPNLYNTQFVGNEIISGGEFKFEGSIIVLILNVSFTILFVYLNTKEKTHRLGSTES